MYLPRVARRSAVVLLATAALLEALCRTGLLPNRRHTLDAELDRRAAAANVTLLGDSFSIETDGSSATRLRQAFAARGVGTFNLAAPGMGPLNYLTQFETAGRRHPSRLVLVHYYVGNDLTDTVYAGQAQGPVPERLTQIARRSYGLAFLLDVRGALRTRVRLAGARQLLAQRPGAEGTLNPLLAELAAHDPAYLTKNLLLEGPDVEAGWARNRETLQALTAAATRQGARVLLVMLPATAQVSDSHFAFYQRLGFTTDPRTLTTSPPQDRLGALCQEGHWHCLDLLPTFRKAAATRELYLANDDHWNDAGHALAFDAITAAIERDGLIR